MFKYKKEFSILFFSIIFTIFITTALILSVDYVDRFDVEEIKPEMILSSEVDDLPYWDNETLIDMKGFDYINFHKICNESVILNVLMMVHTAPSNIEKRMAIRETWGKSVPGMKLLFMMGAIADRKRQVEIDCENKKYEDIIQGNFIDAYKNNTYKHVMCLKYMIYHCPTAKYILKTDDDIYVNVDVVLEFLEEISVKVRSKQMIICSTRSRAPVYRDHFKWAVSFNEYAHSQYPTYCLGPAIIYSVEAAYRLYNVAQLITYFWIDDVHISGTVAEIARVERTNLPFVAFLSGNLLKNFIDSNGTKGPVTFLFAIELKPKAIYDVHRALLNRRKLY